MSDILLKLYFPQSGKQYEKKLALDEEISAGKSEECDIKLINYFGRKVPLKKMNNSLSRMHFRIARQRKGVVIFDESRNGTRVNNENLERSTTPKVLYDGDRLLLAEEFEIHVKLPIVTEPQPDRKLYFDQVNDQFIVDGKPIRKREFSANERRLLKYLCDNANKICSRDEISYRVWEKVVSNNTIDQTVSKLRHKLNKLSSGAGAYIETMYGAGYKLNN